MKPRTVAMSIAVLALPLCAAAQDKPNTTMTVLAQPASAENQDSRLVRAAKASAHANKSGAVITNETLVRTGGRFATMNVTTAENGTKSPDGEAEAKARRAAAAATLQRLKKSSSDYYRQLAPAARPTPPKREDPPTEGQRASTTQPPPMPAAQIPQASTTAVGTVSTTQLGTVSTTPVSSVSPTQPEPATTVRPPER